MSQPHILVVDDMQTSTKMMSFMLKRANYEVTTKNNAIEALQWLHVPGNRPILIISDLNMPQMDGIQFVRRVRAMPEYANVPVLILSAESERARVLACLQAGANDYIIKPVNAVNLTKRIELLLSKQEAVHTEHHAAETTPVGVFSLRGGVGTTSLAVNLSVGLQQLWGQDVSLVDLTSKNSHCALMLGIQPQQTLAQFAQPKDTPLNATRLKPLLLKHKTGVTLLPAPVYAHDTAKITGAMIEQVCKYLKSAYPFVVIDAGSNMNDTTHTALDRSQVILLVLSPEKAAVEAAANALQLFERLNYDSNRIWPVLNQTFASAQLPQQTIENTLGRKIEYSIPFDPVGFVEAINSGVPVVQANPLSEASIAIAKLAYALSPEALKKEPPGEASALLAEVRKQLDLGITLPEN